MKWAIVLFYHSRCCWTAFRTESVIFANPLPNITSSCLFLLAYLWSFWSYPEWWGAVSIFLLDGPQGHISSHWHGLFAASFQLELGGAGHLGRQERCWVSLRLERRDGQEWNLCSLCGNDSRDWKVILLKDMAIWFASRGNRRECGYHFWWCQLSHKLELFYLGVFSDMESLGHDIRVGFYPQWERFHPRFIPWDSHFFTPP